jgi:hypothetical protein
MKVLEGELTRCPITVPPKEKRGFPQCVFVIFAKSGSEIAVGKSIQPYTQTVRLNLLTQFLSNLFEKILNYGKC